MFECSMLELLLWVDVAVNRLACDGLEKLEASIFYCGEILWFLPEVRVQWKLDFVIYWD